MCLLCILAERTNSRRCVSMKNLTTYGKYGQVENGKYVCIIKWCCRWNGNEKWHTKMRGAVIARAGGEQTT